MFTEIAPLDSLFTWKLDDEFLNKHYDEDQLPPVAVEDQPAIAVMETLLAIYYSVKKADYEKAQRKIVDLYEQRDNVDTNRLLSENISINAVDHLIWSTVYHTYQLTVDTEAAQAAFKQIPQPIDSPMDIATIYGCRTIVASFFLEVQYQHTITDANQALHNFSNCPLWQLLRYKGLRRASYSCGWSGVCRYQKEAMSNCMKNSSHPFYLLHQAQMYEECGHFNLAQFVYKWSYETEPNSTHILLELSKGFTKVRKMEMARACLDKVESKSPDNPMLLQHKGLYLCALEKYEEAASYFEAAAAKGMYLADLQYVACSMKLDKKFKHIEYLEGMLEKYKNPSAIQNILLHLAMEYRTTEDYTRSCKRFIEAIEIDRRSFRLSAFQNKLSLTDEKTQGIFSCVMNLMSIFEETLDCTMLKQLKKIIYG